MEAQGPVPGEGAEADYDPCGQQGELAGGKGEASVPFAGGGLVLGRGAADYGRDPEVSQGRVSLAA